MNNKVLLGMSGGVDSSVSALLLKQSGYEVIGTTLELFRGSSCCNANTILDAKNICNQIGIAHFTYDFKDFFKEKIIDYFIDSYKNNLTPNPCVECNRFLKFGVMWEKAKELGCDYIATGHYAKVEYSEKYNRYILKKANNLAKDQSYFLYQIKKEALSHIIFPLEDYSSKDDVRNKAKEASLGVSQKKDSLDICFIPDKDYKAYLINNNYVKVKPGNIILSNGTILGKHNGLFNYTIGQRKGLGIAYSEPLFVLGFDFNKNNLIVGTEKELYKKEIVITDVNLLLFDKIDDGSRFNVRVRYQGKDNKATLYNLGEKIRIIFDEPIKSPTPGQSAVIYLDDIVVGGGIIE